LLDGHEPRKASWGATRSMYGDGGGWFRAGGVGVAQGFQDAQAVAGRDGQQVDEAEGHIAERHLVGYAVQADDGHGNAEAGERAGEGDEDFVVAIGGVGAAGVGAEEAETEFLDLNAERGGHDDVAHFMQEQADDEQETDERTTPTAVHHDAYQDAKDEQAVAIRLEAKWNPYASPGLGHCRFPLMSTTIVMHWAEEMARNCAHNLEDNLHFGKAGAAEDI